MDKINVLTRDHLPWMERPCEGVALGKFIVGLMPRCNAPEGRALIRELSDTKATAGLNDTSYVIERCCKIVRDSATITADDSKPELAAYFADPDTAVLNYCRSRGASVSNVRHKNGPI